MSRRDKLAGIFSDTAAETAQKLAAANSEPKPKENQRVLAGPVRSMSLSLDRMDQEAKALNEALQNGERIVDLDPELIDISFVRDRLDGNLTLQDDLVLSIEDSGQEVPILVRKNPAAEGRFQVAYGHRRLAACRLLKRKVRAVIRPLSDDDLVVAQGIENTARKDLSYIERATFALNLEGRGFGRDVIMKALSTDKTELSKMLSVAKSIPSDIISSVGAAPATGRRRWMELSEKLQDTAMLEKASSIVRHAEFGDMESDQRFVQLLSELSKTVNTADAEEAWVHPSKSLRVSSKSRPKGGYSLDFTEKDARPFGEWIKTNLDDLYEAFRKS
ncbi:plasmid partitioning protein RepB [Neorhizobium sp. T786]|uniref:plasmid partitioning protein RepB n=1 Tax=Pseudorhizobium xiangyangii TaxID=2883104 RepID=UPI001CFFC063|nr:plasmid partitioning protein RepB [Neorhizobium xiangyangii]MCB5205474.1 plasmid partitioning protein RepB [Neorhizobium xiangyangii]